MNFFVFGTDHRMQHSDAGLEAILRAWLGRSDSMRNKFLAGLASFIALIYCVPVGGLAERAGEKHVPDEGPYVQVTSVSVELSTIHKDSKPDRTAIFVQIMLLGEAPPDATAGVNVGTYSSDPPENDVSYPKQTQTIALKEKLTVVKFIAESSSKTVSGKVIIAANIHETSKGVRIKQPESPKDWRAELATLDP